MLLATLASLLPIALAGDPPAWVALGDSYASGPGIPTQVHAVCGRSDQNFAHLAAAELGLSLEDRSCMGATTRAITGRQYLAVPPQLDAVHPGARVVSVSIGGNDVGFADMIARCVKLTRAGSRCADHYREGDRDLLAERLEQAAPRVAGVLAAVRERAPEATILLVGYPELLPEDLHCGWSMTFAEGDLALLRQVVLDLNAMLAGVAARQGVAFVDTWAGSRGHDACAPGEARWVEPVVTVESAPLHRNAAGMRFAADRVVEALRAAGLEPLVPTPPPVSEPVAPGAGEAP